MFNINSICLVGRCTKDVQIYEKIGKTTVAVSRTFKNKDGNYDTDFFDCVFFNITDYLKENLNKGTLVSIEGRLQNRDYVDERQNKHHITEIIVNRVNILGKTQKAVDEPKNEQKSSNINPFEEFGQQFEIKQQEIDLEGELPF